MIGYLAVTTQEPLFYVGGVLVADEYGLPVEFRHTLPVRPTKLQRALYGAALDRYLRSVVIAQRLVSGLEHDPAVVLVSDVHAARARRASRSGYLEESGVDPVGRPGAVEPFTGASAGFLLQLRAGEAPLRLVTEAPVHLYPEIGRALVEAAETMDLFEPMERVRSGLAPDRRRRRRPRGVIRRAAARRAGDELEVTDADLELRRRPAHGRAARGHRRRDRAGAGDRRAGAVRRRRRGRRAGARHLGDRSTWCRWRWPTRRSRSGRRRCASTGRELRAMPLLDAARGRARGPHRAAADPSTPGPRCSS